MPSTSPARASNDTSLTTRWPRGSMTLMPSARSTGAPGTAESLPTVSWTSRPTMSWPALLAGGRWGGPDHLATPDDTDPVADRLHLAELVGDEDDGGALRLEAAHDAHQLVDLLRRQHRRRLVEDQDLRVAGEGLDDLDPLLHTDRDVLDEGIRIDPQLVALRELAHLTTSGLAVEHPEAPGPFVTEHDVLGDGENRHQHEVLVDHADPCGERVPGTIELDLLPVEHDLALGRREQPVEHVHQGRLAGAVLPEETVDLARLDHQVDPVVGREAAEPLGQALDLEPHGSPPIVADVSDRSGRSSTTPTCRLTRSDSAVTAFRPQWCRR